MGTYPDDEIKRLGARGKCSMNASSYICAPFNNPVRILMQEDPRPHPDHPNVFFSRSYSFFGELHEH